MTGTYRFGDCPIAIVQLVDDTPHATHKFDPVRMDYHRVTILGRLPPAHLPGKTLVVQHEGVLPTFCAFLTYLVTMRAWAIDPPPIGSGANLTLLGERSEFFPFNRPQYQVKQRLYLPPNQRTDFVLGIGPELHIRIIG